MAVKVRSEAWEEGAVAKPPKKESAEWGGIGSGNAVKIEWEEWTDDHPAEEGARVAVDEWERVECTIKIKCETWEGSVSEEEGEIVHEVLDEVGAVKSEKRGGEQLPLEEFQTSTILNDHEHNNEELSQENSQAELDGRDKVVTLIPHAASPRADQSRAPAFKSNKSLFTVGIGGILLLLVVGGFYLQNHKEDTRLEELAKKEAEIKDQQEKLAKERQALEQAARSAPVYPPEVTPEPIRNEAGAAERPSGGSQNTDGTAAQQDQPMQGSKPKSAAKNKDAEMLGRAHKSLDELLKQ